MSTDFAETAPASPQAAPAAGAAADAAPFAAKPSFLPDKFWDEAGKRVRVADLVHSYAHLERKMGESGRRPVAPSPMPAEAPADAASTAPTPADGLAPPPAPSADDATETAAAADAAAHIVPAGPADYAIKLPRADLSRDPEIDGLLHAAGFSHAQAQLVYDLAAERVLPVVAALQGEFDRALTAQRLEARFGGREAFERMAGQVKAWGERHLPRHVFAPLASSADGIVALHHMMRAGEPQLLGGGAPAQGPSTEDLRGLIADPRYWRDHDPALVAQVEAGFRRLYPGPLES